MIIWLLGVCTGAALGIGITNQHWCTFSNEMLTEFVNAWEESDKQILARHQDNLHRMEAAFAERLREL